MTESNHAIWQAFRREQGMINGSAARSTLAMRHTRAVALVKLTAVAALTTPTASAFARAASHPSPAEETARALQVSRSVSINRQQVTFYDADGWILRAGTTERETPAGVFAVLEKERDDAEKNGMCCFDIETDQRRGKTNATNLTAA